MKYFLRFTAVFVLACLWYFSSVFAQVSAGAAGCGKNILVMSSYSLFHPSSKRIISALEAETARLPFDCNLEIFGLGAPKICDKSVWHKCLSSRLAKMRGGFYDAIVVIGDEAADFLAADFSRVSDGTPVIFAGYSADARKLRALHRKTTGVTLKRDIDASVSLGLSLYPHSGVVAILSDSSERGKNFAKRAREEITAYKNVEVLFLDDCGGDYEKLFAKIKSLPENAVLIMAPWSSLKGDEYQTFAAFGSDLAHVLGRPYIACEEPAASFGAVGGFVALDEEQAEAAAGLLSEVLSGADAGEMPIVEGVCRPLVDYRKMRKCGLDGAKLPSDVIFINKPDPLWKEYGGEMVAGFSCLAFLGLGALALAPGIARRRAAARRMQSCSQVPARMGVLDVDENILFLSRLERDSQTPSGAHFLKEIPFSNCAGVSSKTEETLETGKAYAFNCQFGDAGLPSALSSAGGGLSGMNAVVWLSREGAELLEARCAPRENAPEFVLALAPVGEGMIAVDGNGRIAALNPAAENMIGFKFEEIRGMPHGKVLEFVDCECAKPLRSSLSIALESGKSYGFGRRAELLCKSGGRIRVSENSTPIRGSNGAVIGAVLMFRRSR